MEGRSFIGIGLALGVAIGSALGVAMDNLAVGIGAGIAIGAGLGVALDASQRRKGGGPENSAPLDGRDQHDSGYSDGGDGGGD
jgi:hypothetical protein